MGIRKNELKNSTIWIVGASSGIGKEIAIQLSKFNNTLILSSRNEQSLKDLATKCSKKGSTSEVRLLDLENNEMIDTVTRQILAIHSKIDFIFLNGGISHRSLVYETSTDVDAKMMQINYFGAMRIAKLVIPSFIKQKSGQFVVTTSLTGIFGFPLRSAYCAAKHALHGFFESVRAELYDYNIGVTLICPGRIQTDISLHALGPDGNPTQIMDDAQKFGMPVAKCVRKMIRSVERGRKEVYIGNKEVLMVYIKRYLPFLFYKLIVRVKPN